MMENTQIQRERAGLVLLNELTRRVDRNPHYSARAFAKSLGVSHTLLSLIMSGKRRVSKGLAKKMTSTFALSEEEAEILKEHRRLNSDSHEESSNDSDYAQISLDTFAILSDWYHYGILSLLELPNARLDTKWLATRLGISQLDAKLAVERLRRLGLIANIHGKWKQCTRPLKVENTEANTATIKHHKQLLQKAEEALDNTGFSERDFSAMTFALDPKLIPLARKKIAAFRRRLVKELETQGTPSEVYQLAVQIYPITKKEKKR